MFKTLSTYLPRGRWLTALALTAGLAACQANSQSGVLDTSGGKSGQTTGDEGSSVTGGAGGSTTGGAGGSTTGGVTGTTTGVTLPPCTPTVLYTDTFSGTALSPNWTIENGTWTVSGGTVTVQGSGVAILKTQQWGDVTVEADVSNPDYAGTRSGLLLRTSNITGGDDAYDGYYAHWFTVPDGAIPNGERTRLIIARGDHTMVELQTGMAMSQAQQKTHLVSGAPYHVKVVAKGASIWTYVEDMDNPVLTEYDTTYASGYVGLRAIGASATFSNLKVSTACPAAKAPVTTDFSSYRGTVFEASRYSNSVQMWKEYDTTLIDRELSFMPVYGLNYVQIYLNYVNYLDNKAAMLANLEDFLRRAAGYGLKVGVIFFDDDGNVTPSVAYCQPTLGVHDGCHMRSPSLDVLNNTYAANKAQLADYVQSVVSAHVADNRIIMWQTVNEPSQGFPMDQLLRDSYNWVKATGSTIPVAPTSQDFLGAKWADMVTIHNYTLDASQPPGEANGGPEHMNTETLSRPAWNVQSLVPWFAQRKTGWTAWDMMVGNSHCRWAWGSPAGAAEPAATSSFHGLALPDGHPANLADLQTLLGDTGLANAPVFDAFYYTDTAWSNLAFQSVAPRAEFDLRDLAGTRYGSPDPMRVPVDNFSIKYTGVVAPTASGTHTFSATADGVVKITVNGTTVVSKTTYAATATTVSGTISLVGGQIYNVVIQYADTTGDSSLSVAWAGPNFASTRLPSRRK